MDELIPLGTQTVRAMRGRRGATSIEYVLIAALVSIGIIAGVTAFATAASDLWFSVASTVTGTM